MDDLKASPQRTNHIVLKDTGFSNLQYFDEDCLNISVVSSSTVDNQASKSNSETIKTDQADNSVASITVKAKKPTGEFNKKVESMFWFENYPPEKSDKNFFDGAQKALTGFENNNLILEQRSKNKGINPFTLDEARSAYIKYEQELNISEDYFYDLEKAQNIAAIQMYTNLCRLTEGCTSSQLEDFVKNKLVKGSYEFTKKNRDIAKKRDTDTRNTAILLAIGGAVVSDMVSSIVNSNTGTSSSHSTSTNSNYCGLDQTCYSILDANSDSTRIKCKANNLEYNIYYDDSVGKYYTRGFMTNSYEKSFKKLANFSCGSY